MGPDRSLFRLSYEVGSYLSIGGGKKARVAKRQCSGPGDLRRRLEHFLQNLGNRRSVGPSRLLKKGGADFDRAVLSEVEGDSARTGNERCFPPPSPFALSSSKGERRGFPHPARVVSPQQSAPGGQHRQDCQTLDAERFYDPGVGCVPLVCSAVGVGLG